MRKAEMKRSKNSLIVTLGHVMQILKIIAMVGDNLADRKINFFLSSASYSMQFLLSLPLGERYQGKYCGSFYEKPSLVLSSIGTVVLLRLTILLGIRIVDKYDFSEEQ